MRTFNPPLSTATSVFAAMQITLAVLGTTALLWYAETLQSLPRVLAAVAIIGGLWLTGAVMQGRLRILPSILLQVILLGVGASTSVP